MQEALHAATATLPHLRRGLSADSAAKTVGHLLTLTQARAVALLEPGGLLAFAGDGTDHHDLSEWAALAAAHGGRDDRLHVENRIRCSDPSCPIGSAVLSPPSALAPEVMAEVERLSAEMWPGVPVSDWATMLPRVSNTPGDRTVRSCVDRNGSNVQANSWLAISAACRPGTYANGSPARAGAAMPGAGSRGRPDGESTFASTAAIRTSALYCAGRMAVASAAISAGVRIIGSRWRLVAIARLIAQGFAPRCPSSTAVAQIACKSW